MSHATPAVPHRNLPLLLLQARERVMARFRPILNLHGVTEQQWRVVRALNGEGPLEPRQIGEMCCISSPSMAGMLVRMEDLGLVDRKRMEQDQRRVLVSLTPRGKALVKQITPLSEETYQELEGLLGSDFIADLYAKLDLLLQTLEPIETSDREV